MFKKVFDRPNNYDNQKDLVFMLGDFNVNSIESNSKEAAIKSRIVKNPMYNAVMPLLKSEYKCLMRTLRDKKGS